MNRVAAVFVDALRDSAQRALDAAVQSVIEDGKKVAAEAARKVRSKTIVSQQPPQRIDVAARIVK